MPQTPEFGADQVGPVDEIQFGLHVNRPTTPKKGWVYISQDVKKMWVCFVDNVWTHVNPVDLTGVTEGQYFKYNGTTGFLVPATGVAGIQIGLDDNKPSDPDVGDIYLATDTQIVYYCFQDDAWTPTYLPYDRLIEFELDNDDHITLSTMNSIFERDGAGDAMPTLDGEEDLYFEIVGGEITPKAS